MSNNTPILEARGLTKIYGTGEFAFPALRGVSLSIASGESIAIVGKSGSGKSTLMHILASLDKPTNGAVLVGGRDITRAKPRLLDNLRNKHFGFVFQQFFMNADNTVLENVILPLKIAGVGARERRTRGLEALRAVELLDKANARANHLSGGQKQRLVIARALINNPLVIFADEPTGNLDSATGRLIEDLLFSLNQQGITLVIVTHDEDLSRRCHRRLDMRDGQLLPEVAQ
ncbi:TPA: ABC transporter ATP-binding protein [Patescibacteria group bacterium]|uniref:ABC transporter domain-containing protein n=2 Tax=Bacteria division Kazan-3B-28 TaxID=1798534 RepID=A0A0G1X6G1_UNCK3|nr:MAG: putative ABC transporter ATP-binding protein [candidate division Kazan bacterium GW2011_GWA1_50_15]KKW25432.1 MAG: hypothetical protein VE99_C0001G0069 [candidate division Kazan bacterium GW2011_GWC1_52_13]KKW26738.1 MAG: hypothetical protein VF00_C0002G0063 [candidate division Kazan bacterium GW2011_GWB1_52_7]HAV65735.1 ABC transporter ATP-binding protein [Patescibacteria group bacterium]HCL47461.1 ABC transporter ATP-binding protein [Patescibacteria group bacterium]